MLIFKDRNYEKSHMKLDFDTKQYIDEIRKNDNYFHTFINRETLAAGVLVLQPGEEDTQTPPRF